MISASNVSLGEKKKKKKHLWRLGLMHVTECNTKNYLDSI